MFTRRSKRNPDVPDAKSQRSDSSSAEAIPPLRFEMLSQPRYLSAVRAMVSNVAQRFGFDEDECCQISLAVDEALCNVINHGYDHRENGRIWVSVWPLENPLGLQFVIEDAARQVDPATIKPRKLDVVRPGGLGVHIIREVMDHVVYEKREEGGMRLTLIKRHRVTDDREEATDGS